MATKKTAPPADPPTSSTGATLDPVDGWPVFTDGMSRRRWLDHTRPERTAQLVEDLKASTTE